jgi:hypothetical protein
MLLQPWNEVEWRRAVWLAGSRTIMCRVQVLQDTNL